MHCNYDLSVRDSVGNVVQFCYGDDGLDPANIEGSEIPVEFSRNLQHAIQSHFGNPEKAYLLPWQISETTNKELDQPRFKKCSSEFILGLKRFIKESIVDALVSRRERNGLSSGLDHNETWNGEKGKSAKKLTFRYGRQEQYY